MAKEDGFNTNENGKEGTAANGNGSTGEEQHSTREKLSTRFKKLKKKLSHNTSTNKHGQADSAAEEKVGASESLFTGLWQPRCAAAMGPAADVTKDGRNMQGVEHGSGASHTSSATLLEHSKQLQHLRGQDLFIQVGRPDLCTTVASLTLHHWQHQIQAPLQHALATSNASRQALQAAH